MNSEQGGLPNVSGEGTQSMGHRGSLLRASEVERLHDASAPLAQTLAWIRSFLAQPHPDLGRSGPVCPFTPTALSLDTIWLAEVGDATLDFARIRELLGEYRRRFLAAEPRDAGSINKAVLVVFPNLGANGSAIIDEVQFALKPDFVESGLMLGEFHATNRSPGLRNPAFFPLRSPVPMLAIRHIVETDLPFLRRPSDPPARRAAYARAYLRQLGSRVTRNNFEQAVEILVEAELQLRAAREETAVAAPLAPVAVPAAEAQPVRP